MPQRDLAWLQRADAQAIDQALERGELNRLLAITERVR